jgi:Flp pilus assembly pilin Flp
MARGGGIRTYRYDDRGATGTEYLGMIVVTVALVLGVTATGIGRTIYDKISAEICKVTGGGNCGSGGGNQAGKPLTNADYEPALCQVSSVTDKAGSKAKILFWEIGNEYGFQEQHLKAKTDVNHDGKVDDKDELVYLTFTDAASVAAKKDFKPGMKVGKFGTDKVELGAGIKVTNGDTWVFESPEEAQKFRDDVDKLEMYKIQRESPGGADASVGNSILYLFGTGPLKDEEDTENRVKKALGDNRKITYGKVGLDASASAGLKISAGDEKKLSASLGGSFKYSPEVTWTDNAYKNTKSYTYSSSIEYGTKVGYEAGPISGDSSASTTQTGTITVTYDKTTGKLIRIDMTRTVEEGGQKDGAKVGGDNGKSGDDKRGGSVGAKGTDSQSGIEIVTNSVSFDPGPEGDHDRAIGEQWLDSNNEQIATPFKYMFDDHAPTKRPGTDDAFGQLMFDKGKTSRMTYTGETNAAEYGFELNLGLSLGFSISTEKKTQTLTDAQFLGAPQGDTRSYVPYSYCAN